MRLIAVIIASALSACAPSVEAQRVKAACDAGDIQACGVIVQAQQQRAIAQQQQGMDMMMGRGAWETTTVGMK